ncbi:transaldolase [Sulfuriflexus mobilis]|uniref:transaldolase n=1 Tax=Sulfuriflexus mobilis TaxID=1811807 RepID=UPI000F83A0BF|nr:transaldolase [Sulfuriflexus mobilis]
MSDNPLNKVNGFGQSIWLDFINRSILSDGTLKRLIQNDDLAGLTSNPAIFEKAISRDTTYADDIARFDHSGVTPEMLYVSLILEDIGSAADHFFPVYERTAGRDGYVSIEVSPLLARDSEASIQEARELWRRLNRPNIMIKIPGTEEGLTAVRTLLAEGINVNVTLLFSVERYARVLETYLQALEERLSQGLPLSNVASVASFFLSRIDVQIDALLDKIVGDVPEAKIARVLRGRAAIASAALAYRHFQSVTKTPRWQVLARAGGNAQRLLWASTGTKDPAYSTIKYIEPLVAVDTVNTLPLETLNAYREQGQPSLCIEESIADADEVMTQLASVGVDIAALMQALEEEGIRKFVGPYQAVLSTLDSLRKSG